MNIAVIILVWLLCWLISSLAFWLWNDKDVDMALFFWSLLSFIPILPILIAMVFFLIWILHKVNEKKEEK